MKLTAKSVNCQRAVRSREEVLVSQEAISDLLYPDNEELEALGLDAHQWYNVYNSPDDWYRLLTSYSPEELRFLLQVVGNNSDLWQRKTRLVMTVCESSKGRIGAWQQMFCNLHSLSMVVPGLVFKSWLIFLCLEAHRMTIHQWYKTLDDAPKSGVFNYISS